MNKPSVKPTGKENSYTGMLGGFMDNSLIRREHDHRLEAADIAAHYFNTMLITTDTTAMKHRAFQLQSTMCKLIG